MTGLAVETALPASFWAKVDRTGDCWLWTAGTNSRGYGCFAVAGKSELVHRLAYTDAFGPIPAGWTVDHLRESGICTSKLCVRPAHLEAVTRSENTRRRHRAATRCRRGHQLTRRPGDRQRRCQICETDGQRGRRAAARDRRQPDTSGDCGSGVALGYPPRVWVGSGRGTQAAAAGPPT